MYLWRRLANQKWWSDNEDALRAVAGNRLAIIEEAGRKRLRFEVASRSRTKLQRLAKQFGGRIEKLSADWPRRFSRKHKTKPLRVGKRLIIFNVGGTSVSRVRAGRAESRHQGPSHLIIPAGIAFGTGEHATTAMSLRLLERVFQFWGAQAARLSCSAARRIQLTPASRRSLQASGLRSPELVVDLGTGSGILALAAQRFGAKRVIAIDNDPVAISTAKQNAQLNKIEDVQFRVGDVRRWKSQAKIDILTANLFSELLIEILPRLKRARWLILSGILHEQESEVTRALKRNKIDIVQLRSRGKWVALLARSAKSNLSARFDGLKFSPL